jgi:hypothetical protein
MDSHVSTFQEIKRRLVNNDLGAVLFDDDVFLGVQRVARQLKLVLEAGAATAFDLGPML